MESARPDLDHAAQIRKGPPDYAEPKLLDRLRQASRARHYSRRTEQSYVMWVKRHIFFHGVRHPAEMAAPEINAFLTHLAVQRKFSASTQNQALSALLFLYRHVIGRPVGDLGEVIRARRPVRLPVVMDRDEVKAVLSGLAGDKWMMASLMYGSGLRLLECLRLRVQDVDLARKQILVRDGKGAKDRTTMLPEALVDPLAEQLEKVRSIHQQDLTDGWGAVQMPTALDRKYPNAPKDRRWQWVFPQAKRWTNRKTQEQSRHHVDPSIVQKAVKRAVDQAGLTKRATCHTFRHSFATLCNPPAGIRLRHPNHPGTPGPRRYQDHHDLHPRPRPRPISRPQPLGQPRPQRTPLCGPAYHPQIKTKHLGNRLESQPKPDFQEQHCKRHTWTISLRVRCYTDPCNNCCAARGTHES